MWGVIDVQGCKFDELMMWHAILSHHCDVCSSSLIVKVFYQCNYMFFNVFSLLFSGVETCRHVDELAWLSRSSDCNHCSVSVVNYPTDAQFARRQTRLSSAVVRTSLNVLLSSLITVVPICICFFLFSSMWSMWHTCFISPFLTCCYNNTVSVDYASVDFVITFVILATLKNYDWLIDW